MTTNDHPPRNFHEASEEDAAAAAAREYNLRITDHAPTVRSSHGLVCPACDADTWLCVTAFIEVSLEPRRYVVSHCPRIEEDHHILCMHCGNRGTVAEFRVLPSEDILIIG